MSESNQNPQELSYEELERRVQERTRELVEAERRLRELSGRLLNLRDEERRRLARELHDSTGQTLAALQLNLSLVQQDAKGFSPDADRRLSECVNLTDEAIREVRTMSYLLHPPMLDEAGLALALDWYVEGFAERSRIPVELDISPQVGRLPQPVELAIFRIVQEALTNVHRHSGSLTAKVQLALDSDQVVLTVADSGRGISAEKSPDGENGQAGVGIRGMRERVAQFGGEFRIFSMNPGTCIEVTIPVRKAVGAVVSSS